MHLCLAPVHAGTGESYMARVTFAVGQPRTRRSCLVLVVSELRWPRRAVIPSLHLHCQRMLSSAHLFESSISECVGLCDARNYSLYHMVYVTLFRMTFLSVTHHVRMSYVLSENRSSIQSLTLMHSATIHCRHHKWSVQIKSHKYIKYMYMPYLQCLDLLHCITGDGRCADPVYPVMQIINRCRHVA